MAASIFSTSDISERQLASVIEPLGARRDAFGWELDRDVANIALELASEDIEYMPEALLRNAAEALDGVPCTRIALLLNRVNNAKENELLARAVCVALAEHWHIALNLDDYACEVVHPPGVR